MGNARIGEQAFKVLLNDGRQVPKGHGAYGEGDQRLHEIGAVASQRRHAHDDGDRCHLGSRGDVSGHLIGRTLVDVRRPVMEGKDRQFEEEPAQSEDQAEDGGRARNEPGQHPDQFDHVGGVGHAEEVGKAEKHHGRGRCAHHEVLDARLHIDALPLAQGDQDVERIARELKGDVDREQLDAADQHHHRQGAGGEEKEELGMVPFVDAVELAAEADHQEKSGGHQDLEDLRKEIHPVGLEEEHPLQAHRGECDRQSAGGQENGRQVVPAQIRLGRQGQTEKHGGREGEIELGDEQCPRHRGNPWIRGMEAVCTRSTISAGKSPKSTITPTKIIRGMPKPKLTSFKWANRSFFCP